MFSPEFYCLQIIIPQTQGKSRQNSGCIRFGCSNGFGGARNDGQIHYFDDIVARSAAGDLRRKNRELRQDPEDVRERLRLLREEQDALQGRSGGVKRPSALDARLDEVRKENVRLQKELEKMKEELQDLSAEIRRWQIPRQKKTP